MTAADPKSPNTDLGLGSIAAPYDSATRKLILFLDVGTEERDRGREVTLTSG